MIEREVVKELVLALLYITSWEEEGYDKTTYRSWRGYPFELLDELTNEGLITGNHRAKSIYLSDEGVKKAIEIISKYNLEKDDFDAKKEEKE